MIVSDWRSKFLEKHLAACRIEISVRQGKRGPKIFQELPGPREDPGPFFSYLDFTIPQNLMPVNTILKNKGIDF